MMCGSLQNWPRFFEQAYKNLEPGGWFELQDINVPFKCDDGSFHSEQPLWKWNQALLEACEKLNRPVNPAESYKKWMEETGFVDIHEVVHKWPQNPWAKEPKHKEIGLWTMVNFLQGLHGLSMRPLTRGLGMMAEEVEVMLVDVRKDVKNPQIHAWWPM
jgi:hypothetical protein